MIHAIIPKGFQPVFEVVSCFFAYDKKILLLHRLKSKSEGGKWGLPAGKVNKGETREGALKREVYEETKVSIDGQRVEFLGTLAVTHGERDFFYHSFQVTLPSLPEVVISRQEHKGFAWKTIEEALTLPLVTDLDLCIEKYKDLIF